MRMIELRKLLKKTKANKASGGTTKYQIYYNEYSRLGSYLEKAGYDIANEIKCENLGLTFEIYKAWKVEAKRRDKLARQLSKRGCVKS